MSFQDVFLKGFVNRVGLSKCPRSHAKTEYCSVKLSRLEESCVPRERVQQRNAQVDKYGQELDALFKQQRVFEDSIASLECEAVYDRNVAEKEWPVVIS